MFLVVTWSSVFVQISYEELFKKMVEVCASAGKKLDPLYFHCDCECAIINAVKCVFPNAQIKLCRFHVVDAMRRNGNQVGLRRVMNQRADCKKFFARIRQILFFPPRLWPRALKVIWNKLGAETKAHPVVIAFYEYLVIRSFVHSFVHSFVRSFVHSLID